MQRRPCLGIPTHQTASLPTTALGAWPAELNAVLDARCSSAGVMRRPQNGLSNSPLFPSPACCKATRHHCPCAPRSCLRVAIERVLWLAAASCLSRFEQLNSEPWKYCASNIKRNPSRPMRGRAQLGSSGQSKTLQSSGLICHPPATVSVVHIGQTLVQSLMSTLHSSS